MTLLSRIKETFMGKKKRVEKAQEEFDKHKAEAQEKREKADAEWERRYGKSSKPGPHDV